MKMQQDLILSINFDFINCLFSCKHCYANFHSNKNIDIDKLKNLAESFAKAISDKYKLIFSFNKHPLLYKNIFEIYDFFKEKNYYFSNSLPWNGIIYNNIFKEKILTLINKKYINSIMFSLFGDSIYHNYFTGYKNAYKDMLDFAEEFRDNIQYIWIYYLTKENLKYASEMKKIINDKFNNSLFFYRIPHIKGNALKNKMEYFTIDDFSDANLEINSNDFFMVYTEKKLYDNFNIFKAYKNVFYYKTELYIDSDLNIYSDYQHENKINITFDLFNVEQLSTFLNNLVEDRIKEAEKFSTKESLEKVVDFNNKNLYDIYDLIEIWNKRI